jgi:uncharacterized membrane protein YedE/YeeE
MMRACWARVSEAAVGLLFGWGLLVSGMTDPGKVLGFLDLAGLWDPSLAFVMGAALIVVAPLYAWARRRPRSVLGAAMQWPTARQIDRRLGLGAALFGMGWGMAGFCPGPAWVSMAAGHVKAVVFVAAMLAGMGIWALWERWIARSGPKHNQ